MLALCCLIAAATALPAADTIVTNARIWTVDRARPEAEALAILGERIVAVGSAKEVGAWRGPKTRVLDAHGKRVLPGFNDAHLHLVSGGMQLDQVQLTDARSLPRLLTLGSAAGAASEGFAWLFVQWEDRA